MKIYLDDFGTGHSSLSHLHQLPVDALKIDRSFVESLLLPERPAIVESILALAYTLGTGVVAEGVEDEVQALALERLGCRHAQGFLFSPPIPAAKVEELLASGESTCRLPSPDGRQHPELAAALGESPGGCGSQGLEQFSIRCSERSEVASPGEPARGSRFATWKIEPSGMD